MSESDTKKVEYTFSLENQETPVPKNRLTLYLLLGIFQVIFIFLFSYFTKYPSEHDTQTVPSLYSSKLK
jgi:hypothetical protein